MRLLNIALLGACPGQLSGLAADLDRALQASGSSFKLAVARSVAALSCGPAGLAGFDLVLLAGLENSAHPPDGHDASGREAADRSIRMALALAGLAYRVLYGTAAERLAHALHAVHALQPAACPPAQAGRTPPAKKQPWVWMCDKCSDPQCEHRLLTALLARRDGAAGPPEPAAY